MKWTKDNYQHFIADVQNNVGKDEQSIADIVYFYGGSTYKTYNETLRFIDGRKNIKIADRDDVYAEIELLKAKISDYPLQEDIVVYRYRKLSIIKKIMLIFRLKGYIITERGFMSTTLLPYSPGMLDLVKTEKYNTLIKIVIHKGVPAIPLVFNEQQSLLKEHEMLFMPDMRLKLIKKSIKFSVRKISFEFEIM